VDATQLVLPAIILLTALALVMSGIAIVFQIRRDRLPDATRYENIKELRAQEESLLADRRQELSIVEQKIQQRDRLIAEVASHEERLAVIKAELATLEDARHEIEEVKTQAAKAAGELATVSQQLNEKRAELQDVMEKFSPKRIEQARRELDQIKTEHAEISTQLQPLRAERDNAVKLIEEAKTIAALEAARKVQLDALSKEIEELERRKEALATVSQQLNEKRAELQDVMEKFSPERLLTARKELDEIKTERDQISSQLQPLRAERDNAFKLIEEAKTLPALEAARKVQLETLSKDIEELERQKEPLETLRKEADAIKSKLATFRDDVTQLEARKALLEQETGGATPEPDEEKLLDDLFKVPSVLEFPAVRRQALWTESEALHSVGQYLNSYNLKYSDRTVHAFHTALKINDFSQLTVLAGVSGTGKSLLPRRYAEAMGIHFLQIAVEPRWDSPQDLLGFYNYIEKNYRATDLARLLVHMNPYEPVSLSASDRSDHIALVLLDEMNLARVEYYFSEFLSRLEARPRYDEASDARKRADATIPIDIRGLKKTIALFPSHNVVFVGTMNDDESTQSLSDKVLDRSNILQFAAPTNFPVQSHARGSDRPREAQSFKSWRTWIKPASNLEGGVRTAVDGVIEKLAKIMEDCGRPFGHRLRDAIIAYVANYPAGRGYDYRAALVDQIEFRILPKLRGLEIENHRAAFDDLDRLLRDELNDSLMADRIAELQTRQAGGTGLFVWRGLTR
jgi:predicted  nucleic acid-binding Zn-ribbon protein